MAFSKNKRKIVTSVATATMIATAIAPAAASTMTTLQTAKSKVNHYYNLSIRTLLDVQNSAKEKKSTIAYINKYLTSSKYANEKAYLLARVEAKSKAINKYYYNVILPAQKEAAAIKTAEAALKLASETPVTAGVTKEQVEAAYNQVMMLINAVQTDSKRTELTAAAEKLKADALAKIESLAVPKVSSVTAISATQIEIKFNKILDSTSIFDGNGNLITGVITINSLDSVPAGTLTGELSADKQTLTISTSTKLDKRYDVIVDKVKTADKVEIEKTTNTITVSDTVRPTFAGVTYQANGNATFTFSEPIDATATQIVNSLTVTGPTAVSITAADITIATDKKSFSVALPTTMTKDQNYSFTLTGIQDFAGNLLTPNPVTATVVKKDVDTVKPTVTSVVSAGVGKVSVTFSEQVNASDATLTVGGVAASALTTTINDGKTVVTFNSSSLTAGVKSLVIGGVKDLAGNTMDNVSKVVEITADTTAPAFVSQSIKTVAGVQYLVLNYTEDVTVDSAKSITGTYVGSDSITKPLTAITGADLSNGTDGKSIEVKLPAVSGDVTFNLPVGLVKDTAGNPVAAKTTTFKLGTAVDTTKPLVNSVVQTNNKVVVTFDREVSAASALNLANYVIEGVSSPFEGNAIFKGDAKTVELTLKADAITTTGARVFTVQNVATGAGTVMDSDVKARNFIETVRPTVVSAKVLDETHIEVTFSEALLATTGGTDLEVFQGTSTTALSETSETISGDKVIIELATPLTTLIGLQVKAESTIDLKDLNSNVVKFTDVTVVQ